MKGFCNAFIWDVIITSCRTETETVSRMEKAWPTDCCCSHRSVVLPSLLVPWLTVDILWPTDCCCSHQSAVLPSLLVPWLTVDILWRIHGTMCYCSILLCLKQTCQSNLETVLADRSVGRRHQTPHPRWRIATRSLMKHASTSSLPATSHTPHQSNSNSNATVICTAPLQSDQWCIPEFT